jgi:VanZ family protein
MALIFWISSLSRAPLPEGLSDKTGHGLGYLGLAVVVLRALTGQSSARVGVKHACVALLIAVGYGVSDEFHQSFVPGRSSDVHDVVADAAGAATGLAVWWAWGIIRRRSDV